MGRAVKSEMESLFTFTARLSGRSRWPWQAVQGIGDMKSMYRSRWASEVLSSYQSRRMGMIPLKWERRARSRERPSLEEPPEPP